jgi:hypothetical protein
MGRTELSIDALIKRLPNGGLASEAFLSLQRGEMTFEQWITTEALESAKRAPGQDPKHYPPMPDSVRSYCEARIQHRQPYDKALALKLGTWFDLVNRTYRWNQERIEHFAWGEEKMREVKLDQFAQMFTTARERFEQVKLDCETAALALRTKALDADARVREG